jgi:glycosyltransferase involved in cell wall biosynthesis
MKIVIAVSTYNRPTITRFCLDNLSAMRSDDVRLVVYDDASDAYDKRELLEYADEVIRFERNGGIERSRARAFRDFTYRFTDYDLLYLTDNDTLHDGKFIEVLQQTFAAQETSEVKLPMSVYNTRWHNYDANVVMETESMLVLKTMPGVSQCYNREMAQTITDFLNLNPEMETVYGWDYHWPEVLKRHFIVTKTSYVEHFARDKNEGGMHCVLEANGGSFDETFERDRALNPTEALQTIRPLILQELQ